jgi:hypothetical protein
MTSYFLSRQMDFKWRESFSILIDSQLFCREPAFAVGLNIKPVSEAKLIVPLGLNAFKRKGET